MAHAEEGAFDCGREVVLEEPADVAVHLAIQGEDNSDQQRKERQGEETQLVERGAAAASTSSPAIPALQPNNAATRPGVIALLAGCWCCGTAGVFIQISSTSNVAASMYTNAATKHVDRKMVTIPIGILIGVASLSSSLVQFGSVRFGQRFTFLTAALIGCIGAVLNYVGVKERNFELLCIGAGLQGITYAATNALRFSVAQFATKADLPKAMSFVLLGGCLSAVLGPEMSKHLYTTGNTRYANNYLWLAGLYLIVFMLHCLVPYRPVSRPQQKYKDDRVAAGYGGTQQQQQQQQQQQHDASAEGQALTKPENITAGHQVAVETDARSIAAIFLNPQMLLIVMVEASSYALMAGVMSATPLQMNSKGFSFEKLNTTIMVHMVGMFLPGLISGNVIQRVGSLRSIFLGFALQIAGCALFFAGDDHMYYNAAMFVLGVGWNFSFVASSSMFNTKLRLSERLKAIALNDTFVLGLLCVCMTSAGFFWEDAGWDVFLAMYILWGGVSLCLLMAYRVAGYHA